MCKERGGEGGGRRTGEDGEGRKEQEREEEEERTKEPPPGQSVTEAAGWESFRPLCSCPLQQLARRTANLGLASSEDSIVLLAT